MALSLPTVEEVRVIFETSISDVAVQSFIDDAELLVSGCAAVSSMAEARQKAIIKFVAAHMMYSVGQATPGSSSSGVKTSEAVGDASVSYSAGGSNTFSEGLGSSRYGQQALALETSGCLARVGKPRAMLTRV